MAQDTVSRRGLLQGAALTVGAAALLQQTFQPSPARAQSGDLPAGTIHSFATGGVTFHTYVSPAQAVHVTAHIVEFDDQLLLVDSTFIPPTAQEVAGAIASTGKPVGMTEMSGVPVEFRHYENAEAPHHVVVALPDQKVAIVQDLVYNGVFFAPGVDRANWIAILEDLRDDPACEALLVGHGLPTNRGDLDTAIAYIKVMDDAMTNAATPDEASAMIKAAFPGYSGEFLLSLIPEYWTR